MDRSISLKFLLISFCLALAVSGCSSKSKDAAKGASAYANDAGILKFIPADTPYVMASAQKAPDDVVEKIKPVYSEGFLKMMRQSVANVIDEVSRDLEEGDGDPAELAKAKAANEAFAKILSKETFENSGLEFNALAAIYGVGMIPVMRIEVADPGKLEATIAKFEAELDGAMSVASVGGQSYRYAGDEDGRFVVAIVDGYLVMTIVPTELSEDAFKSVLGMSLPKQNIAAAGHLSAVAEKYSFGPHLAGFVDVERISDIFVGEPNSINSELLKMMEYDNSDLSDICKSEIRAMSGVMPRIVFGYNEMSTERMASRAVFELREDLAKSLTALAAPVPGLGVDHGGLMSFGFGLDLLAARNFYEARLDALTAKPYECELFAEMQAGVEGGRAALEAPLPPIVYGIKGFVAVVDSIEGMDLATQQPPTKMDMSLLVATDNAAGLVAMGAFASPELASVNLKPDGKPVEISLPPMGQPFTSAQLAMNDSALGVGVGDNAGDRISKLVASDATEPPPVMSMHVDMANYYAFTADMMEMAANMDPTNEMSAENMSAFSDGMKEFAKLFDRMSYDIILTENGVEMPSVVTLVD